METTILDIVDDPEEYFQRFVNVEGVVPEVVSDGFYLCAEGEEYYFYTGQRPTPAN